MDRECFFLFFLLLPTFVLFIFATLQLLETGYSPFSLVRYAKATVVDLKELGFSAKEIRFLDFSLDQLMREGEFSLVELFEAGYHVSDFKKRRGWAPDYYVLSKLRDAGYTAVEMKKGAHASCLLSHAVQAPRSPRPSSLRGTSLAQCVSGLPRPHHSHACARD